MNTSALDWRQEGDTLVEFLEAKAREYGHRPALYFKPGFRYQTWTYQDLWEGSGRVASLLQHRGLEKNDRVLLWGPNCPQWVLAFFGCLRAGLVVVPLDLRSSPDFVERVASKTRPKLAFVSRVTPDRPDGFDVPEMLLDQIESESLNMPEPRRVGLDWDDLAEVIFTSGTTGDPKGVMLTHGNLLANMISVNEQAPGKPTDRLLSLLPLSHMFEQMGGLLIPLRNGSNITYLTSIQPSIIVKTAGERKPTLMLLVPQALSVLMNGIEREVARQGKEKVWRWSMAVAQHAPTRVRRVIFRRVLQRLGGALEYIFSGGAALDPELGEKWERIGVKISQGYGATEASPVISCHTFERPGFRSAGPPVPGMDVKVSAEGELLIRGPNVTQGYWEAPDRTVEAFEGEWYKTGDLGFIDSEGSVHVKGRKKDMIVLASGQNVYPEDVETVLNKHPDVTDVSVVGLPKDDGLEVHAVILTEKPDKAAEAVAWANRQLAEHQRIRGHTVWPEDDFPRTHTLKVKKLVVIDRLTSATAGSAVDGRHSQDDEEAVRSPVVALVADIAGVMPTAVEPGLALGDDMGLDSLNRVELLSAIEETIGVYVDESKVTPGTTVSELEALVDSGPSATDIRFPRWGMAFWCRALRGLLQRGIIFPAMTMAYKMRVTGVDNLDLQGPALIAANHTLHLDNGIILRSLPTRFRHRLAIAASDHMWRSPIRSLAIPLLGNGFPFSKEGNVRKSLDNVGRIIDNGWSVLIYPEGELTVAGPMKPFLAGTGLICVGGRVPVIPLKLKVIRTGFPRYFPLLSRGEVEIRFGEPLRFGPGVTYQDATMQIEEAVRAL